MAEIPGSGLEELALGQAELITLLNQHLTGLWASRGFQTLTPGNTVNVNWTQGGTAYCLLDRATTTFAFSGAAIGQRCVLILQQDGSGGRNAAFGAEVREGADTPIPPTLTATANATDYLGFIYNSQGSRYDHVSISLGFGLESSASPSISPSISPSLSPSRSPSLSPSASPSLSPSLSPSVSPSLSPSPST